MEDLTQLLIALEGNKGVGDDIMELDLLYQRLVAIAKDAKGRVITYTEVGDIAHHGRW